MEEPDFFDIPTIPIQNICREANVSRETGRQALERAGLAAHYSPTRRILLTPNDGRRLFELLTQRD